MGARSVSLSGAQDGKKGRRAIALSPTAVIALREHKQREQASRILAGRILTEDALVFAKPDGSPLKPDTISQAFLRISRQEGLKGVRLHDLRHSHASLLLQQGVHPKIVQERLGHATISVTLDTYSHVLPGLQEAAAMAFEKGLVGHEDSSCKRS
ncbi:MAG: site-specific integrase [Dehalococcoidia bacterium]|nr:site-specific integrase [Dehalococcoidia bacterium]